MKGVIKLHTSIYRGEHWSAAGPQGQAADCVTLPYDERWSTSPVSLRRRHFFFIYCTFTFILLLSLPNVLRGTCSATGKAGLKSFSLDWTGLGSKHAGAGERDEQRRSETSMEQLLKQRAVAVRRAEVGKVNFSTTDSDGLHCLTARGKKTQTQKLIYV